MELLTDYLPPSLLLYSFAVAVFAGIVKGAVGFALPLIIFSGLGLILDPTVALAGLVLATVSGNFLQVLKSGLGDAWRAIKDFRVYIGLVCVFILLSAQLVPHLAPSTIFLGLGVPITLLCAVQLAGPRLIIAPAWRGAASVIAGVISGLMGGIAGTWGPTTVLYLVAIETPKSRQLAVQGVIYGLGSLMLLAGHLRSGILNAQSLPFSAAMVVPVFFGMWIGFRIHDRIEQETFRKITLTILLIAGVNLIRRGIMGA